MDEDVLTEDVLGADLRGARTVPEQEQVLAVRRSGLPPAPIGAVTFSVLP